MGVRDTYFSGTTISFDFFDAFCGDRLGGGVGREVFVCNVNPDLVVKIETDTSRFQNAMEWRMWQDASPSMRKWLAPCVSISPCGTVLIQKRTAPLRIREMSKWRFLPEFITDIKMSNFGMLDGNLVCHDYGIVNAAHSEKMRKVSWDV